MIRALTLLILSLTVVRAECEERCARIVTLAPSLTEVLYDIGLGDRIVGVTRFDQYPREVESKAKIGGFYDPNFETILRLKPSIVFLLEEHRDIAQKLKTLHLETVTVDHRSVKGILESYRTLGAFCGKENEAHVRAVYLREEAKKLSEKVEGVSRVRTLVVVGRDEEAGRLKGIYVSGRDGYYSEMLEAGGGMNVYSGITGSIGSVSNEGIMRLNPQAIIEIVPPLENTRKTKEEVKTVWRSLTHVDAVKNNRIYVFDEDFASVPGPRFVVIQREIARALHPERF